MSRNISDSPSYQYRPQRTQSTTHPALPSRVNPHDQNQTPREPQQSIQSHAHYANPYRPQPFHGPGSYPDYYQQQQPYRDPSSQTLSISQAFQQLDKAVPYIEAHKPRSQSVQLSQNAAAPQQIISGPSNNYSSRPNQRSYSSLDADTYPAADLPIAHSQSAVKHSTLTSPPSTLPLNVPLGANPNFVGFAEGSSPGPRRNTAPPIGTSNQVTIQRTPGD